MTYPPPSLVARRSRASWLRRGVLVATLALLLGTCTVSRLTRGDDIGKSDPAAHVPDPFAEPQREARDVPDAPAAAMAGNEAVAAVNVADAAPPAQPPVDARQPNRWYYVPRLGDGPGAIFSRTGGGWDYAFACIAATRTIEFIAVNIGDPGGFDQQYMRIGRAKLMMDASYSREGQGTIITRVAATHPFFNAFAGPDPSLELQLLADRKVVIPIGAEVLRLIRDCGGAPSPATPAAQPARHG